MDNRFHLQLTGGEPTLAPVFAQNDQEDVVLVGHVTDHCIWTVYPAFYQRLRKIYGKHVPLVKKVSMKPVELPLFSYLF